MEVSGDREHSNDSSPQERKWMVLAAHLQPINGKTRMSRVNLVTGEQLDIGVVSFP